jgi:hypothetical protein
LYCDGAAVVCNGTLWRCKGRDRVCGYVAAVAMIRSLLAQAAKSILGTCHHMMAVTGCKEHTGHLSPHEGSNARGWQGSSCSPIGGPETWPLPERGPAMPEARWQGKDGVCLMLLQAVRKHQCSGMFQSCLGESARALQHYGRVESTRDRRSTARIAAEETLWDCVRAAV